MFLKTLWVANLIDVQYPILLKCGYYCIWMFNLQFNFNDENLLNNLHVQGCTDHKCIMNTFCKHLSIDTVFHLSLIHIQLLNGVYFRFILVNSI